MPKFTYSASKGIEQSSGSGFYVNDVPILEEINALGTISADPSASLNAYGVHTFEGDGSNFTITLPATGLTIGQKLVFIVGAQGGTVSFTDLDSTSATANKVFVFIAVSATEFALISA